MACVAGWCLLQEEEVSVPVSSWRRPMSTIVAGDSSISGGKEIQSSAHLPKGHEVESSGDDKSTIHYTYDDYLSDIPEKMVGSTSEYYKRKALFDYNKEIIRRHNSNHPQGHMLGLNQFMDRFDYELPQRGYDKTRHEAWSQNHIDPSMLTKSDDSSATTSKSRQLDYWSLVEDLTFSSSEMLPKSVDWRTCPKTGKPLSTPVKAQGRCGSCWAFATTAALESHVAMASSNKTLFSLSMQELVSCVPNPNHCGGKGGCSGSTAELALDFIAVKGIVDEWHFGYQSFDGRHQVKCSLQEEEDDITTGVEVASRLSKYYDHAVATVHGYAKLPTNNYTSLMHALAKVGPVIVNVAADPWRFYESGVFTPRGHSVGQTDINHVVVLMGYGTDETTGEDYWLVRNSYGPQWGEEGYIRLKRVDPATLPHPDADCGMDVRPADGIACTEQDDDRHHGHHHITPPAVKVCGTSGILFDPILPIGARMLW
ncbi:Senescence-specific cysteine protease SAG39 [Seminavis robusta]|uniref:Senescence-specific cysteine protease SAG39 n=1 Tax=Seminavis robusta TaxID=568900 RepID=A0A9N8E109_9STRA|nr:Senescence-specific cysteine protease SAG39 [Seminavis robusta]|eukprot:Sro541_g163220.1 Senescence-specific cysteine protease SAG39 (483) ;mRNA; f:41916-43457